MKLILTFSFIFLIILAVLLYTNSNWRSNEIKERQKQATLQEEKCKIPEKVAEVVGVELWVYHPFCNSNPIYFSKPIAPKTIIQQPSNSN